MPIGPHYGGLDATHQAGSFWPNARRFEKMPERLTDRAYTNNLCQDFQKAVDTLAGAILPVPTSPSRNKRTMLHGPPAAIAALLRPLQLQWLEVVRNR